MTKYIDFALIGELVDSHNNVHYEDLARLPAADVKETVSGKWIKPTGMMPPEHHGHYECSVCQGWALTDWLKHKIVLSEYCPHCGAKMENNE